MTIFSRAGELRRANTLALPAAREQAALHVRASGGLESLLNRQAGKPALPREVKRISYLIRNLNLEAI